MMTMTCCWMVLVACADAGEQQRLAANEIMAIRDEIRALRYDDLSEEVGEQLLIYLGWDDRLAPQDFLDQRTIGDEALDALRKRNIVSPERIATELRRAPHFAHFSRLRELVYIFCLYNDNVADALAHRAAGVQDVFDEDEEDWIRSDALRLLLFFDPVHPSSMELVKARFQEDLHDAVAFLARVQLDHDGRVAYREIADLLVAAAELFGTERSLNFPMAIGRICLPTNRAVAVLEQHVESADILRDRFAGLAGLAMLTGDRSKFEELLANSADPNRNRFQRRLAAEYAYLSGLANSKDLERLDELAFSRLPDEPLEEGHLRRQWILRMILSADPDRRNAHLRRWAAHPDPETAGMAAWTLWASRELSDKDVRAIEAVTLRPDVKLPVPIFDDRLATELRKRTEDRFEACCGMPTFMW